MDSECTPVPAQSLELARWEFWGRLETREAVLVGTLVCAGQLSAGGARDDASAAHRFLIEFPEFCDGTDL
jgi:hypothetical protein